MSSDNLARQTEAQGAADGILCGSAGGMPVSSGQANKSVVQIYRISDKTGELILLEEGGTDGHDETSGNTLYYKLINNEKVYITKEEYNSWQQNLMYKKFEVTETISEYMPCTPLFDQNHPAPEPYVPRADG